MLSIEHKNKISKSLKGKSKNREHAIKAGNASGISRKGKTYPHMFKNHSDESKLKISKSRKGQNSLNNHWNWQGGISFELYSQEWKEDLKESIRKRDNFICQICGIHQDELDNFFKKLDVHHIDYNKNNCNPDNLISLCRYCHMKTNNNREDWINYFNY